MNPTEKVLADRLYFTSSIRGDSWKGQTSPQSYEWWYFDALSDAADEAVSIIFFDNFPFSPRYNSRDNKVKNPALVFCYYRTGKPIYRIACEFQSVDFSASQLKPSVQIQDNFLKFDTAPYGQGYLIEIKTEYQPNKFLEASFEWLLIESDFSSAEPLHLPDKFCWNMAAPRSDVTGHIRVTSHKGKILNSINFRGSGYHDHKSDNRYLPAAIESWQWGRAHFSDSTAVFCRYKEFGSDEFLTKLYVVRQDQLRQREATFEEQQFSRDIFGIKYPNRFRLVSGDNMKLRVKSTQVIDSSFFYLRFLSEMTLTLRDGKPRKTIGITEHLAPKMLNYRWLDWLIDRRIARKR